MTTAVWICNPPEPPEWHSEREHLAVEDNNGKPYISGCDCERGEDHYS